MGLCSVMQGCAELYTSGQTQVSADGVHPLPTCPLHPLQHDDSINFLSNRVVRSVTDGFKVRWRLPGATMAGFLSVQMEHS